MHPASAPPAEANAAWRSRGQRRLANRTPSANRTGLWTRAQALVGVVVGGIIATLVIAATISVTALITVAIAGSIIIGLTD